MRLEAMAVEFPTVHGHPNRVPFTGVLTLVDEPSDKAPNGARGHRVVLTRAAAEAALPSLLGMAVDFKAGWDGHDAQQKCGIVTGASIVGREVRVRGYLFARDFRDMMQEMHAHGDESLGMSYELADAHVEDMRAEQWRLTKVTFTGAAILLRSKAAYRNTSFRVLREEAAAVQASAQASAQMPCRALEPSRTAAKILPPPPRPRPHAARTLPPHAVFAGVSRTAKAAHGA